MSRILSRIRHKKLMLAAATMIIISVILWCLHMLLWLVVWWVLALSVFCLNELVRKKLKRQRTVFEPRSGVRNVDFLVIGDLCHPADYVPDGKSFVSILAPGRGLKSSFQILRHTHSILRDEGGTVVIVAGKSKKEFTVFDIPFLHKITIRKYHLRMLQVMSLLPLLSSPNNSIKFLIGKSNGTYLPMEQTPPGISAFCTERNYSLICVERQ